MQKNVFVEMFSLINRLYNYEDYMYLENIPEPIGDFFYVSRGMNIEGKYITFKNEFINLYIIKDTNRNSIMDTILINNIEFIVIVVPDTDYKFRSDDNRDYTNSDKVEYISRAYNYIFKYIMNKINPVENSSLDRMLKQAGDVLTILSESFNICDIEEALAITDIDEETANSILELDVASLFIKGAILAYID